MINPRNIHQGKRFLFNVKITSNQGEYFKIKYSDMKRICEFDEDVCKNYNKFIAMKRDMFQEKVSHLQKNHVHIKTMKRKVLPEIFDYSNIRSSSQTKSLNHTFMKTFIVIKQKQQNTSRNKEAEYYKAKHNLTLYERSLMHNKTVNTHPTRLTIKRDSIISYPRPHRHQLQITLDKSTEARKKSKAETQRIRLVYRNNIPIINLTEASLIGEQYHDLIKPRVKLSLPIKSSSNNIYKKFYLQKCNNKSVNT